VGDHGICGIRLRTLQKVGQGVGGAHAVLKNLATHHQGREQMGVFRGHNKILLSIETGMCVFCTYLYFVYYNDFGAKWEELPCTIWGAIYNLFCTKTGWELSIA
jgi:hypothetical protein